MILHVDMDAFYASVEVRERPELRGKPVIVGGSAEGRGVVSAASYEARQFGVRSAMPAKTARRLCPHGIFLPPRIDFYARVSESIRGIFERYTPLVEPLSLDEAFLDVTGSQPLFGSGVEIGRRIQREIREQIELPSSVGVAPTKFLAKIASDLEKPNGFVVVDPGRILEFLDPLPVSRLWGVGRVTGQALARRGIRTIGDVRRLPPGALERELGQQGGHLWQLAQGIDERRVVPDRDAKSISHETTFAEDIGDAEVLRSIALELAEQVAWRLRRHGLRARTLQLKIRYSDFRTLTRSATVDATHVTQEICDVVDQLLARLPPSRLAVRLVGVGASGFDAAVKTQQRLFGDEEHAAQTRLDQVTDRIREKFGADSLRRARRRD